MNTRQSSNRDRARARQCHRYGVTDVVYREWTCAMLVPVYGPAAADAGRRKTADGGSPAQAAAATAAPAPPPTGTAAAAAAAEGSLVPPPPPPPAPSPMKPCREFCHRVEEQCPYFHPAAREQYAGEPVFICIEARNETRQEHIATSITVGCVVGLSRLRKLTVDANEDALPVKVSDGNCVLLLDLNQ
ncbi:hypothetical protein HPB49_013451 [Dermacentor silvarum]|uniref:Uncharacterized protein n=1 Tax=Dermacentor silvarum TaxID=543639 RepID=A0ACB8DDK0_DERSI|nr:hypothetical protein HPB49_013451 [Dermacentor silvarum]